MSTKRLAIFAGVAFMAFLAFFLLTQIGVTNAGEGTRAQGDYQTAANCADCHPDNYDNWTETAHARVFDSDTGFYQSWSNRSPPFPKSCTKCHVIGWNLTSVQGYDPAQAWNSTYNTPKLGIQCENCHGPDPMNNTERSNWGLLMNSSVCGTCHQGSHHPYYPEWQDSSHANDPPAFVKQLACARCHEAYSAAMYLEGVEPTSLPPNPIWQITCATCHDPHSEENEYQLRTPPQNLCGTCHTSEGTEPEDGAVHHPMLEMRQGTANVPVPSSQTMSEVMCQNCHKFVSETPRMSGHDFVQRPEACAECHNGVTVWDMNEAQAENTIEFWQLSTENNLEHARVELDAAWLSLNQATTLDFDTTTRVLANTYYLQANYSANFVEADGSMGAHNYQYANSLISFANLKAGQVVVMLTPGTVSGQVVDASGNGVSGVQIMIGTSTKVWATTGADGSFSFPHAPGSFNLRLVKDGKDSGSAQAIVMGGQTTELSKISLSSGAGTGPAQTSSTDTMQLLNTLLIVIAIVLILVTMMVSRKKPSAVEPREISEPAPPPAEKQQ